MAKFKVQQSADDQWYWTLVADNGEIVATSETYTTEGSARHSILAVRDAAAAASVE